MIRQLWIGMKAISIAVVAPPAHHHSHELPIHNHSKRWGDEPRFDPKRGI